VSKIQSNFKVSARATEPTCRPVPLTKPMSLPLPISRYSRKIQYLSGGDQDLHYFAYGSNMNWEQMQRRCPSSQFVCVGRLPHYRFAIARHSRLRNCGTANIFPEKDSEVLGIVYYVCDQDLNRLDSFEDGYRRKHVIIHPINNGHSSLASLVYIAPKEDFPPLPNAEYKRLMLEGALHWRLPDEYRLMLESIAVVDP
jgi:Gamma-glutamyl cyclotransferase, AIG2-like